ncbi:leucine-rich repeat domain-containing protein [Alkalihalobacterium chitinilyticum]|uniref:Leucine-rich repeat domain-containing protein n=1 Tax=Alkalihalobacterium chitinilyticum TaxID=2980103 RepID=A0ABT5VKV8_9BACI|nr:leucine-rich repeat domain-containing protein [Alkalihalobacterium chitinilyticum]MDE5416049.1 leucine-rich repeat domain-containing protein [Alkalihalobacterium chitinilyticum]
MKRKQSGFILFLISLLVFQSLVVSVSTIKAEETGDILLNAEYVEEEGVLLNWLLAESLNIENFSVIKNHQTIDISNSQLESSTEEGYLLHQYLDQDVSEENTYTYEVIGYSGDESEVYSNQVRISISNKSQGTSSDDEKEEASSNPKYDEEESLIWINIAKLTEKSALVQYHSDYRQSVVGHYRLFLNDELLLTTSDFEDNEYLLTSLEPSTNYTITFIAYDKDGAVLEEAAQSFTTWDETSGETVDIPDRALYLEIVETLGISERDLTTSDMKKLTTLRANRLGIRDLTGLEFAQNLSTLQLSNNSISNFQPLESLTELKNLDVSRNDLTSIEFITDLNKLENLNLVNNQINNIEPLLNLANLRFVSILNNPLEPTDDTTMPAIDVIKKLEQQGVSVEYGDEDFDNGGGEEEEEELLYIHTRNITDSSATISWHSEQHYPKYVLFVNGEELATFTDEEDYANYYHLKGLQPAQEYVVRIVAFDNEGSMVAEKEVSFTTWEAPSGTVAYIPDDQLRHAFRQALGIQDRELMTSDLLHLERFELYHEAIEDYTGLNLAENLTSLTIYYSEMEDLTPVASLKNLTYLELIGNRITNLEPLSELSNLRWLDMTDNRISDVNPISRLTQLEYLNLGGNQISDIAPLRELKQLYDLHLSNNEIEEITMLLDLPMLSYVNLSHNPLDMSNQSEAVEIVKALLEKGVHVQIIRYLFNISEITETSFTLAMAGSDENLEEQISDVQIFINDELHSVHAPNTHYTITDLHPDSEYDVMIKYFDLILEQWRHHWFYVYTSAQPSGEEVIFYDKNLEENVRDHLGIYDRAIRESDMENLNYINLSNQEIVALNGLEYAINLQSLYANGNQIKDLTPITELKDLRNIDLSQNELVNIIGLEQLSNVTSIFLYNNPIDYSEIANLMTMRALLDKGVHLYIDRSNSEGFNVISEELVDSINLQWDHNLENISHFELFLNGQFVAQVDAATDTYTFEQLNRDQMYMVEISVRGQNDEVIGYYVGNHYTHFSYSFFVTNPTESTATFNWWYPSPIKSVEIVLGDKTITTIEANKKSYFMQGLEPDQTYELKIRALNENNELIQEHYYTFSTNSLPTGDVVNVADENLKQMIKEHLGIFHRELYETDMERLTWLHAAHRQITDLTGLEKAVNLEGLVLWNTGIKDLSHLEQLTHLRILELNEPNISDFSFLSQLENLESLSVKRSNVNPLPYIHENVTILNISFSNVDNFSGLERLINLRQINLSGLQIEDLSFLGDYPQLEAIHLSHNPITDISILLDLEHLQYARLARTKLDLTDGSEASNVIDQLQQRGVWVSLGDYFSIEITEEAVTENSITLDWDIQLIGDGFSAILDVEVHLDGQLIDVIDFDFDKSSYTLSNLEPGQEYMIEIIILVHGEPDGSTSQTVTTLSNENEQPEVPDKKEKNKKKDKKPNSGLGKGKNQPNVQPVPPRNQVAVERLKELNTNSRLVRER